MYDGVALTLEEHADACWIWKHLSILVHLYSFQFNPNCVMILQAAIHSVQLHNPTLMKTPWHVLPGISVVAMMTKEPITALAMKFHQTTVTLGMSHTGIHLHIKMHTQTHTQWLTCLWMFLVIQFRLSHGSMVEVESWLRYFLLIQNILIIHR